jgi:uncharacterized protein YecT (DUF1311 family)
MWKLLLSITVMFLNASGVQAADIKPLSLQEAIKKYPDMAVGEEKEPAASSLTRHNGVAFPQTQFEINQEKTKSYDQAEENLNLVYQKVLSRYKNDPDFIKALHTSQRLWIKLRDSELLMQYPMMNKDRRYYGSVFPMCRATFLTEFTQQRTETLQKWLDGSEEGDVCSGSIKFK